MLVTSRVWDKHISSTGCISIYLQKKTKYREQQSKQAATNVHKDSQIKRLQVNQW